MDLQQIETLLRRAEGHMRRDEYDEAIAVLDSVEPGTELDGTAAFIRGNVYLRMEQDARALQCYADAMNAGFIHFNLYLNLATAKLRQGHVVQAEMMYRQAADLQPHSALPLNRIIQIRLERADIAGAEKVMDELAQRCPELFDGFHHKADLLLETARASEALELLDSVEPRFSSHTLYIYDRCRALARTGEAKAALDYLETKSELFEDEAVRQLYLKEKGKLFLQLGEMEQAKPYLTEIYENFKDREAGFALIGEAFSRQDFDTVALISAEMAETKTYDRAHYMCLYYIALAAKISGDGARAKAAFQQALDELGELGDDRVGAELRAVRVSVKMELELYDDAIEDLDSYLRLIESTIKDGEQKQELLATLRELETAIRAKMDSFV